MLLEWTAVSFHTTTHAGPKGGTLDSVDDVGEDLTAAVLADHGPEQPEPPLFSVLVRYE